MNRTLITTLFLAACTGGGKRTDTDGPPPPVVTGCEVDEDCDLGEICDVDRCEVGDRDNSFDDATPIRLNEVAEGVIDPPGDIDFFVYESLGPEWIRVHSTNSGDPIDSLDTVVQIFASNGSEHARADNFATGRVNNFDSVVFAYLPFAGTWFITVEDVSTHYVDAFDEPRGDEGFTYTLEMVEFNNFSLEPDSVNLPTETIELPGGSTIVSFGVVIDEPGDSDWIVIDPPFAGEPLEIWGTPTPGTDATPLVNLYRRSDETLVASKADIGNEGFCSYFSPEDELYTLEATDALGGGSNDHWYVVYVRTYEPGANHPVFGDNDWEAEVEPNDDQATATLPAVVVDGGNSPYDVSFVDGILADGADLDHYTVALGDGLRLSVRCWDEAYGSLADLAVSVLDAAGTDVTPAGQGLEATSLGYYVHNVEDLPAGDYTVRFAAEDGQGGLSAYYRCTIYQTSFTVDVGNP
ncbi:MAG: hypothetical protein H6737_15990 [Alphaproteobacteria bacterium]|nr:hypothetical protein [Alphaproteobacteria bacterium]